MASHCGVAVSELQYKKFNFAGYELAGDLRLPRGAESLVVLVHASGGGHSNPRNHFIAEYLARHGMGTLVIDLLTRTEQRWDNLTGVLRFDIALLADRLVKVIDAIARDAELRRLAMGLFGASTGAAVRAGRRRSRGRCAGRWSVEAGAPIWPPRRCARSKRRRCRWWARKTR